jgi:hypothetical protein
VRRGHPLNDQTSKAELLEFPWCKSAYWNGRAIAQSYDSLTIPRRDRIPGNEIQTALVAIEVIKNTNNIALIPDITANDYVKRGLIKKVVCPEVEMPSARVTFGVNSDKVNQKLYNAWTKLLIQNLKEN